MKKFSFVILAAVWAMSAGCMAGISQGAFLVNGSVNSGELVQGAGGRTVEGSGMTLPELLALIEAGASTNDLENLVVDQADGENITIDAETGVIQLSALSVLVDGDLSSNGSIGVDEDPPNDLHVGNRGYNDARYAFTSGTTNAGSINIKSTSGSIALSGNTTVSGTLYVNDKLTLAENLSPGDYDAVDYYFINSHYVPRSSTSATTISSTSSLTLDSVDFLTIGSDMGIVFDGPIGLDDNYLMSPKDPTSGNYVGDRDYTDARYAFTSGTTNDAITIAATAGNLTLSATELGPETYGNIELDAGDDISVTAGDDIVVTATGGLLMQVDVLDVNCAIDLQEDPINGNYVGNRDYNDDRYFGAVTTVADTTYILSSSDEGAYVRFTNASGCTITMPSDDGADWSYDYTVITIRNVSSGTLTLIPDPSDAVAVINDPNYVIVQLRAGDTATLKRVGENEWDVI